MVNKHFEILSNVKYLNVVYISKYFLNMLLNLLGGIG